MDALDRRPYPLPSNGWRPGQPHTLAGTFGRFHGALHGDAAHAWLGRTYRYTLWPAGWTVRFERVQLFDPDGQLFADEYDILFAATCAIGDDRSTLFDVSRDDHGRMTSRPVARAMLAADSPDPSVPNLHGLPSH